MPDHNSRNPAPAHAGHPARVFGAAVVLLVTTVALLNLAGCKPDSPAQPKLPTSLDQTITLAAEPAYTAGTSNTIVWSVAEPGGAAIPADWSFVAQRATDADFAVEVNDSPWLSGDQYTFTELVDGVTSYYRVKARNGQGLESDWSAPVSSTQDGLAPAALVLVLEEEQTSLMFNLEITAEDATSGVQQVELWFRKNAGDLQLHGVVEPGVVRFQTDAGGPHEFIALATDHAGNTQAPPNEPQATTVVPEPIILVDVQGYAWDITNAVLRHGIHLPWWDFGLGRFSIEPAIEPLMLGPGDNGWPDPGNIADVVAVDFDGDQRAYKISDLYGREVADDVVNGVPIAAAY